MSTVVSARTNGATNPEAIGSATGFAAYSAGTGETGAVTYITGASDGPLAEIGSYARWTVTAAKTSGSTGWQATSGVYRPKGSGKAGDSITVSLWLRSSVATTVSMRAAAYTAAGTSINTSDVTGIALPAGQWVRVSSTVVAAADFGSVGWWAYQTSGQTLPANAIYDATGVLSETQVATLGSWFDGDTAAATDSSYSPAGTITYSWTGAANASTSTMMETVPLQDYQLQLPDGSITGAGRPVGLTAITGLRDLATLRGSDMDNAGHDGALPGASFASKRAVGVKFLIAAPPGGNEAAYQPLAGNWQNVKDPSAVCLTAASYLSQLAAGGSLPVSALQVQLPGRTDPLLLLGRPSKLSLPIDHEYQFGWWVVDAEWGIPDGLIYDATPNIVSCVAPTATSGAPFAWHFPVRFPVSSGGSVTVPNGGSYPAKPVYRITGPVTNPRISNPATGQAIQINLTLVAGDVLIIDGDSRAVRLNGANRNTAIDVTSSFFTIPKGGVTLRYSSSDSAPTGSQLTVYTLDTYSTV